MAGILWRDVNAPRFGDALQGLRSGGEALQQSIGAAKTGLGDWQANRVREQSNSLMKDLMTVSDPRALAAALKDGTFLKNYDPRLLSAEAIAAIGGRQKDLRNDQLTNAQIDNTDANTEQTRQITSTAQTKEEERISDREDLRGIRDFIPQIVKTETPKDFQKLLVDSPELSEAFGKLMPNDQMNFFNSIAPYRQGFANLRKTDADIGLINAQKETEKVRPAQIRSGIAVNKAQIEGIQADTAGKKIQNKGAQAQQDATALAGEIVITNPSNQAGAFVEGVKREGGLVGGLAIPSVSAIAPNAVVLPKAPAVAPVPTYQQGAPAPAAPTTPATPAAAPKKVSSLPENVFGNGRGAPGALGMIGASALSGIDFNTLINDARPDSAGSPVAAALEAVSNQPQTANYNSRAPKYPSTAASGKSFASVPFAQVKGGLIGSESAGRYDALAYDTNGGRRNGAGVRAPKPVTRMTLGEVFDFQSGPMRDKTRGFRGKDDVGSTGAGAYQFESRTLRSTAERVFGKGWRNQIFSPATQDRLAENLYNSVRKNPAMLAKTWTHFSRQGGAGSGRVPNDASSVPQMLASAAQVMPSAAFGNAYGNAYGSAFGDAFGDAYGSAPAASSLVPKTNNADQAMVGTAPVAVPEPVRTPALAVPIAAGNTRMAMLENAEQGPSTNVGALLAAAAANARKAFETGTRAPDGIIPTLNLRGLDLGKYSRG